MSHIDSHGTTGFDRNIDDGRLLSAGVATVLLGRPRVGSRGSVGSTRTNGLTVRRRRSEGQSRRRHRWNRSCTGEVRRKRIRTTTILDVAEANDCEYAFLVGYRWSPTRQVIFGDTVWSVVLPLRRRCRHTVRVTGGDRSLPLRAPQVRPRVEGWPRRARVARPEFSRERYRTFPRRSARADTRGGHRWCRSRGRRRSRD